MPGITTDPPQMSPVSVSPPKRDFTWPLLTFVALGAVASAAILPSVVRTSVDAPTSAAADRPLDIDGGDQTPASSDPDFLTASQRLNETDLRAAYADCIAADRKALAFLRRTFPATTGGAAPSPGLVRSTQEQYRRPLCERYGLTLEQMDAVVRHGARADWPRPR